VPVIFKEFIFLQLSDQFSHINALFSNPNQTKTSLSVFSPQYLLHYLPSVQSLVNRHAWCRTPVVETSWALLRDCYHGAMCIHHTPQHIAIATLYLALNSYGVELPVGEKEWWQVCVCDYRLKRVCEYKRWTLMLSEW